MYEGAFWTVVGSMPGSAQECSNWTNFRRRHPAAICKPQGDTCWSLLRYLGDQLSGTGTVIVQAHPWFRGIACSNLPCWPTLKREEGIQRGNAWRLYWKEFWWTWKQIIARTPRSKGTEGPKWFPSRRTSWNWKILRMIYRLIMLNTQEWNIVELSVNLFGMRSPNSGCHCLNSFTCGSLPLVSSTDRQISDRTTMAQRDLWSHHRALP